MTEITTLSQFLTTAKTQFQVYDLGRRVQHIDMLAFHQIESLSAPYPYPIQGHAQFAIVFWDASQQHFIWFLKLALDEQGLLSPAPRSQFIEMILAALGQDPTQPLSDEQQLPVASHPNGNEEGDEEQAKDATDELQNGTGVRIQATHQHPEAHRNHETHNDDGQLGKLNGERLVQAQQVRVDPQHEGRHYKRPQRRVDRHSDTQRQVPLREVGEQVGRSSRRNGPHDQCSQGYEQYLGSLTKG